MSSQLFRKQVLPLGGNNGIVWIAGAGPAFYAKPIIYFEVPALNAVWEVDSFVLEVGAYQAFSGATLAVRSQVFLNDIAVSPIDGDAAVVVDPVAGRTSVVNFNNSLSLTSGDQLSVRLTLNISDAPSFTAGYGQIAASIHGAQEVNRPRPRTTIS